MNQREQKNYRFIGTDGSVKTARPVCAVCGKKGIFSFVPDGEFVALTIDQQDRLVCRDLQQQRGCSG